MSVKASAGKPSSAARATTAAVAGETRGSFADNRIRCVGAGGRVGGHEGAGISMLSMSRVFPEMGGGEDDEGDAGLRGGEGFCAPDGE